MMDLATNSFDTGDLMVEFSAGIIAVAKAGLLLSKHQQFAGSKINGGYIKEALHWLVEVYGRQILSF